MSHNYTFILNRSNYYNSSDRYEPKKKKKKYGASQMWTTYLAEANYIVPDVV